jgi:hypothetical protein
VQLPIQLRSIKNELRKLEAAYKNTPAVDYILATSISIPNDLVIPRIQSPRATITFPKSLPRKISRKELQFDFQLASHDPHPAGYRPVLIHLKSRSVAEAVEVALDEVDYVRVIWNLYNNGVRESGSPGKVRPINRIRLGQVHTLHQKSGKLVDPIYRSYWYERTYVYQEYSASAVSSSKWQQIKKHEAKVRRRLARCPYEADLIRSFVRYARALDSPDDETAFLKLWSLLEFLTNTDNYDRLIDRVKFLYEDVASNATIMQHLRYRRNNFAHSAIEATRPRLLLYQLEPYVERLMRFHLFTRAKFANREDAAGYLDFPKDPDDIRDRIKRYRMALAFRTHKAAP